MTTHTEYFPFAGGLNLNENQALIKPGELLLGVNYECLKPVGYRRIDGFERCDGRPLASGASYYMLPFTAGGTTAIAVNDSVTGVTSSASATVLAVVVEGGAWATSDAAGYIVLGDITGGPFVSGEDLNVSAAYRAVTTGTVTTNGAGTDALHNTYLQAAIELRRSLITAPTGQGALRGAWIFNGAKYAFRDATGGASGKMWKATSAGWVEQDLGITLNFTTGTSQPSLGDTINGQTSGATGILRALIVNSGTWGGGNAAGRMILSGVSGTFQAGENLRVSTTVKAVQSGAPETHALPAGGHYEFINHNFYGATNLFRMYAVNGVGRAFEFDGHAIVPIITGMSTDTPNHIGVLKNHLFLSFPGGSLQHSPTGNPTGTWTAVTGASEIGAGDDITGIVLAPGDVLATFCRNKISMLYGSSTLDWNLVNWSHETGAIEWTVQRLSQIIALDDRGLTDLAATQKWGDFMASTFSVRVDSLVQQKKGSVTCSVRVREKDQYRLFFNDGTGLIASFAGDKLLGFTQLDYGIPVRCAYSVEDSDGSEVLLFGSDDGQLYLMDSGTSFDGEEVEAYLRIPCYHYKRPREKKRFRKLILDVNPAGPATLYFTPDFDNASPLIPSALEESHESVGVGGYFGVDEWNNFVWSAMTIDEADASIDGIARSMGAVIRSSSIYDNPHELHGATVHYSPRGLQR